MKEKTNGIHWEKVETKYGPVVLEESAGWYVVIDRYGAQKVYGERRPRPSEIARWLEREHV